MSTTTAKKWTMACPIHGGDPQPESNVATSSGTWIGYAVPAAFWDTQAAQSDTTRLTFSGACGHVWWIDVVQQEGQTFLASIAIAAGGTP